MAPQLQHITHRFTSGSPPPLKGSLGNKNNKISLGGSDRIYHQEAEGQEQHQAEGEQEHQLKDQHHLGEISITRKV